MDNASKIAKLEEWRLAKQKADGVKPIVAEEQRLRKEVFNLFFPTPKEGTDKVELGEGWLLKGTYKLDRKIDEAALPTVQKELREIDINPDLLVNWEPKLKTAIYKELTEPQRRIFDQALVIKPGSPTVELVPPKKKKE